MHPSSLFSLSEHLERLSRDGDPLEVGHLEEPSDFGMMAPCRLASGLWVLVSEALMR